MFRKFIAVFLVIAFAGMPFVAPAMAQQASSGAEAPAAGAVAVPAADNPVETARQQLADDATALKALAAQAESAPEDDQKLAELKMKADALTKSVLDLSVSFNPRLTQIRERLTALGEPPAAGTAEDPAVKAEREKLLAERASINAVTGDAEALSISAKKLSNQLADARRTLFTTTLLKKTDVDFDVLSTASNAFAEARVYFLQSISSWFRFVWNYKFYQLMSALFLSLVAALVLAGLSYRMFAPLLRHGTKVSDPPYITRLAVAFWSTILPSIALGVFESISLVLLDNFKVLRIDITPILEAFLALVLAVFFVYRVLMAVLSPFDPEWRLALVTDRGARLLTLSVVALAAINSIDYFLTAIIKVQSADVMLTVAKSYFTSIISGLVIVGISFIRPLPPVEGGDGRSRAWPRAVRLTLVVAGLGLILAALLGYVGLARFASTQIVMAGAVIVTMYIGLMSGRAIIHSGAFAGTLFGQYCRRRFNLGDLELDQIGLAVGFAIYVIAIGVTLPLLLAQWGFQLWEIGNWVSQIFTEVSIGKFHFSLLGILTGVILFFVGLYVTRWLQRWFDGTVLARSRLDSGVRNSVKTGFGYVGIAIVSLFAISAAGIDLSSLALVAGALSLGIGFGLQNIVSNFVSGLILLVERPFKVGDWVVTGTTEGFVRRISVRATEIETFQHLSIIVPNSELINASVGNWTHKNRLGRVEIPVGVSYSSDPSQVMEILMDIARNHKKVLRNPEPFVVFHGFGDSSLDFEIRVHLADVLDGLGVKNDIRLQIFERFREAGIEIPFPQRDLNLKFEDGTVALIREAVGRREPFAGNPEKVFTNMGGLGHRDDDADPDASDADGDENQ